MRLVNILFKNSCIMASRHEIHSICVITGNFYTATVRCCNLIKPLVILHCPSPKCIQTESVCRGEGGHCSNARQERPPLQHLQWFPSNRTCLIKHFRDVHIIVSLFITNHDELPRPFNYTFLQTSLPSSLQSSIRDGPW